MNESKNLLAIDSESLNLQISHVFVLHFELLLNSYFLPMIRSHPYQERVARQWLCIEITINSSLGFSILLHGFLLLCHMLHRFNIPAFRLVVYHHLSGLSFTMPCSCYILTCSNPGIFAQELQLKA